MIQDMVSDIKARTEEIPSTSLGWEFLTFFSSQFLNIVHLLRWSGTSGVNT